MLFLSVTPAIFLRPASHVSSRGNKTHRPSAQVCCNSRRNISPEKGLLFLHAIVAELRPRASREAIIAHAGKPDLYFLRTKPPPGRDCGLCKQLSPDSPFLLEIILPRPTMIPKDPKVDAEPLLDGQLERRPSARHRYYSCGPEALASPRQSVSKPGKHNGRSSRAAIHHHKDPQAYAELPIFENPCPICFLDHYNKALKAWLRQ